MKHLKEDGSAYKFPNTASRILRMFGMDWTPLCCVIAMATGSIAVRNTTIDSAYTLNLLVESSAHTSVSVSVPLSVPVPVNTGNTGTDNGNTPNITGTTPSIPKTSIQVTPNTNQTSKTDTDTYTYTYTLIRKHRDKNPPPQQHTVESVGECVVEKQTLQMVEIVPHLRRRGYGTIMVNAVIQHMRQRSKEHNVEEKIEIAVPEDGNAETNETGTYIATDASRNAHIARKWGFVENNDGKWTYSQEALAMAPIVYRKRGSCVIRKASKADLEAIVVIENWSFRGWKPLDFNDISKGTIKSSICEDYIPEPRINIERLTEIYDAMRRNECVIFVAVDRESTNSRYLNVEDGQLLGAVCCTLLTNTAPQNHTSVAEIGMFAVDPDAQGAGIGRHLFSVAESCALRHFKANEIHLHVVHIRDVLVDIYKRQGYEHTGRIIPWEEHVGKPCPAAIPLSFIELRKILPPYEQGVRCITENEIRKALEALESWGAPACKLASHVRGLLDGRYDEFNPALFIDDPFNPTNVLFGYGRDHRPDNDYSTSQMELLHVDMCFYGVDDDAMPLFLLHRLPTSSSFICHGVDARYRDIIFDLYTCRHAKILMFEDHYEYRCDNADILSHSNLSKSDLEFSDMPLSHASLVNARLPYKNHFSEHLIEQNIKHAGGIIASVHRSAENVDVVAWTVFQLYGYCIGQLHVEESARQKGIGSALVREAARRVHAKGFVPTAYIVKENYASRATFTNVGFVPSEFLVDWSVISYPNTMLSG